MTAIADNLPEGRRNDSAQSPARRGSWANRLTIWLLPLLVAGLLVVGTLLPIGALLIKSILDPAGNFVGAANFERYATEPGLAIAAWNSVTLSSLATLITILIAYPFSFALTRSLIPYKGLFRAIIMLPLLAPSLLPALGMIYLFGTQGSLKSWLMGGQLYGPFGIVVGSVFYALPTAVLILSAGLAAGDGRLYEAARALKAGPWRAFFAITLPSSRYSLVSACSVVFVLVFTDFGVPTVVGGSTNMLATDIYKLVIGRFDFQLGAVVGVLLLIPAIVAYVIDFSARRAQRATLSGKSIPVTPVRSLARDAVLTGFCVVVSIAVLGVIGMAIFGSLVKFWPYNLTIDFQNYTRLFSDEDDGRAIVASLLLASWTAFAGALAVAVSGWLVARRVGQNWLLQVVQGLAMLPVAVPGLVLGLGYIFFFNEPANPLNVIYASLAILVLCTVAHFYTVPHLMVVGALLRADPEIDLAARALHATPTYTARRIHLPALLPTLVDVAGYYFVNAMTTVSALIFLFTANTRVGSIVVVNLLEGSRYGQAAALSIVIMLISLLATLVQIAVRTAILKGQPWHRRAS
jgi:iron(III) transport system permease protein